VFTPNFNITSQILENISNIEVAKEIITSAPLIPAWKKKFQKDAQARTIHYGTHLEGNELTFTQAKKVIDGKKVVAKQRDIQEVINYRNLLKYLNSLKSGEKIKKQSKDNKNKFKYTEKKLKKIHKLAVESILDEKRSGYYRQTKVVLKESKSGEVVFTPPEAVEVPYQITDFFKWLNSEQGAEIHSVLRAGIAHFELVRIHPFVDGNGRTARAFATLILFLEGYDIKKLFSLEEHFDKDAYAYYNALQSVKKNNGDLTEWLVYFSHCLAVELEKIKDKVKKLSLDGRFKDKLGRQIALSERQVKLVEYLKKHQKIKMKEAKELIPKVSEDTILRDLKDLMKKKIVQKKGRTKAARYLLAS